MQTNNKLEDIVKGCINLSRESQHHLYRYFYSFCFRSCAVYCQTNDDALEVVNDGFLKIFKELKNFKPRYENFEISLNGWIKRIMINTAIDHYRKNKSHYPTVYPGANILEVASCESSAIDMLSHKEIIKLVQQLSPSYRIVFSLYVIHGFKHEEIARELNISIGTSKSNLAKARLNIQKMILVGSGKLVASRENEVSYSI